MTHWSDSYIGAPYIPEVADCMHLAERVAREVLGLEPGLPQTHEASLRKQAEQISRLKSSYAERVGAPIDGHPALFVARGKFYHCGAVALIDGVVWVLHNDQAAGMVVRERLREMTNWAYKFEGFYKWIDK